MKKLYSLFTVLLVVCCSKNISAQQTTFQAGYGFGTLSIPILTDIIQAPSGRYLVTGTDGVLPIRGVITEIDSAANVIFSKEYVATIQTEIVDVKNVATGGFIAAGESNPGLVLMRLDSNANVIWANTYHIGGGTEENASRVLPTSDGGFVVAGYVYGATPPGYPTQDSANCYILKVNSAGTLLWAKTIFCSVAYINNHYLNDVAEATDGYVFVGSMAQNAAYQGPTWSLVVKTDFSGNITYIKHVGSSGDDDEATSIVSLTGTTQVIGGDYNSEAFFLTLNSTTGSGTGYKYGNGIIPPYLNYNTVPTLDGNYAMIGMAPLSFATYLMKVNPSTGVVDWGVQGYNGGFAALLPEGRQAADSGFILVTTALGEGGYVEYVVKTNSSGSTSPAGCSPSTFNPGKSSYSPTYTAFTPDSLVGSTGTTFSPTILNVHPSDSVHCLDVVCTAPANPSTSSASPSTICQGSSSTITGSGSSGPATYEIFTTATGGSSIGNSPLVVSPTVTTTYYVESLFGAGCVSASRTPVTVTVNPAPSAVGAISGNVTPCPGAQAYSISSVVNATTYTWSVSGGGTITAGAGTTNITVTWTTAGGPYMVSVTASNNCGSAGNSINVTVGGGPGLATASASPNPACVGQTVGLSVTSSGSANYAWTGPGGYTSTSQTPSLASIQANEAGIYTVTASNSCGSVTASVNVVVNSKPNGVGASASPNPACQGQTVNLTGSGTGASSWSWSGPNAYTSGLQSPSLTNIQANEAGTYTLIATNACGTDTITTNLVVNTAPTAVTATAAPNPVCAGTTVNLNGSATGATSYSWSGPDGYTATTLSTSLSNFQSVNVGTYTLSATNSCGASTASVTVTITTAPTSVTASASNTTTCFGSNIQLTGTANGATTYGWAGPDGFTSSHEDTLITNCLVAQSGTYVFTAVNACGRNSSTVNIQVDTLITGFSAAAASGDTLCSGYQLALKGTGANVNTWLWSGPNGFISASQDTTIASATAANNGQYILTATNACQSLHDTLHIDIENGNLLPLIASSSAVHDSACYGATINLFASDSFDSYNWTGPDGFVSTLQNPTLTNASVAQSGVYVVTAANHCGQKSDSVHIYIDTIPQNLQLTTTGANNASCQGQNITVTASSPGITNWSWTGPAGFSSNQVSFTIQNIQPNQQGNYIVTATDACGSKTDTVQVTVYPLPDSLFVGARSDSICPGLSVLLTARNGLSNVIWSNNQTGDSINVTQPGNYYYTGQDANSCAVNSDTITVYNAAAPSLNLFSTNPNSICEGQQTVVLRASSDQPVNITWYPGAISTDTLIVTAPGEYSVIAEKNGCYASDSINVALAPIPSVSFTDSVINTCCVNADVSPMVTGTVASYQWSDTTGNSSDLLTHSGVYSVTVTSDKGCTATGTVSFNKVCILAQATATPDTVQVGNTSMLNVITAFTNTLTYQWGPIDSISNSMIVNPVVNPQQTTTYTVAVHDTVSGCTDTVSVTVYVLYQANFAIPNVFAPKGNNPTNQTWYVINQGGLVTVEDMKVFDRWGEEVFDSERDGTIEWNGYYKGKLQLMGNYVYMVKVKINATGEEKVVNGNLALIW